MGRRKILETVTLQSGGSYTGWSASGVCSREVLQQKFDQALTETRATTLYAETTECHIKRMEKFWTEYCAIFALEPRETLRECQSARIENFLHWVVRTYTIKKTSTVTTYWRQLSQLHITWWQCRISPQTLKEIFVFIEGSLTKEYGLDNTESEKPLLEAEEFVEVIQYHWAADINVFPNERQRVQVAAILLLAAYTGSRPGALLHITYRDLRLYVEKHRKTGKHELKLAVTLTKTKSGQKRKRPKTYTFHLDENPVFCIITHMISIAFDDEAYNVPELVSPRQVFALKAKKGPSQTVPWKQEKLDIPVFRRAIKTPRGVETSKDVALPYNQYHGWLVLLGVALGFIYTLTTYCLRRALGNAINDDPNSNAAVRNLVLDHETGSKIFERNYLSRIIRYFTQDQFWGRSSDHDSARTASQIGLFRDLDRPRKLSAEQAQQVRQDPEVRELAAVRDRLCAQIEEVFGVIQMAKGEPIYNDYQAVKASLAATIRKKERALLKQIQEEYDLNAPVLAIQQQLNGDQCDDDDDDDDKENAPAQTAPIRIAERRYIAECAVRDPSVLHDQKGYAFHVEFSVNLIALCKRRDRRPVKTRYSPEPVPVKTALDSPRLSQIEPEIKRDSPLKCQGWQCVFCLTSNDLPLEERECRYKRKYTLQKHVDRCRLKYYGPDDPIPCPDDHACAGLILNGKMELKAHFAHEHGCFL